MRLRTQVWALLGRLIPAVVCLICLLAANTGAAMSRSAFEEQMQKHADALAQAKVALAGDARLEQLPRLRSLHLELAGMEAGVKTIKSSDDRAWYAQLCGAVSFYLELLEVEDRIGKCSGAAAAADLRKALSALENRKLAGEPPAKEALAAIRKALDTKTAAMAEELRFAATLTDVQAKTEAAQRIADLDAIEAGPLRALAAEPKFAAPYAAQIAAVRARITERKPRIAFADRIQEIAQAVAACGDRAEMDTLKRKLADLGKEPLAGEKEFLARIADVRDRALPALAERLQQKENTRNEEIFTQSRATFTELNALLNNYGSRYTARFGSRKQVGLYSSRNERFDPLIPSFRDRFDTAASQLRDLVRQHPELEQRSKSVTDLQNQCTVVLRELEEAAGYIRRANALIEQAVSGALEGAQRAAWIAEFENLRSARNSRGGRLWDSLLSADAREYLKNLGQGILRPSGLESLNDSLAECVKDVGNTPKKLRRGEAIALKNRIRETAARSGWTEKAPPPPPEEKIDRDMKAYAEKLERWQRMDAVVQDSFRKVDDNTRTGGWPCCD